MSSAKKGEIVETLLERRKKLFAANWNLKAALGKEAETKVFGGKCTVESGGKELKRKFRSHKSLRDPHSQQ